MRKYRKWREIVIEQLAADRNAALDYIQFAVEEYQVDGDTAVLLLALQTFVESQGGITELAKKTNMESRVLSEVLAGEAAPPIDIFVNILSALGCKLTIQTINGDNLSTDIKPTEEKNITKFENLQTQLAESDSAQ